MGTRGLISCARCLCLLLVAAATACPVSGRMQIERLQREFQARYEARTGERVTWPPCPCNQNTPPAYPKDEFYGDELDNAEFAAFLVEDLAEKVLENWGGAMSGFVDPGALGTTNEDFNLIPRPINLRPVTVQNYAEQFVALRDYLPRLTHRKITASWVGAPGFPDPDKPAMKTIAMWGSLDDRTCEDARDLFWDHYNANTWIIGPSTGARSDAGVCIDTLNDMHHEGYTVIRGRIKADLSAHAGVQGEAQCVVMMEPSLDGFGNAVAPTGLTLTDVWQVYTAAAPEPGSIFLSPVIPQSGQGEPPILSPGCDYEPRAVRRGWRVSRVVVLLEPEFDTEPDSDLSCADLCCPSCRGECLPGGVQAELGSLEIYFDLGGERAARDAGFLYLHAEEPDAGLASPIALQHAVHPNVEVIYDGATVRQFMATEALVDVQVDSPYRYDLRFYLPSDVGSISNGVYTLIGTPEPFSVATIENPDAAAGSNRLHVTSSHLGEEHRYAYTWDPGTWSWQLLSGEGTEQQLETLVPVWTSPDETREDTYSVSAAGGKLYEQVDTYRVFPWGEEQVASVVDPGGRALSTTWAYYDDEAADGHEYGQLRQRVDPGGYWETYRYDASGRIIKTVMPYLDAEIGSAEEICKVTDSVFAPYGDDAEVRTDRVRIMGVEVERTHVIRERGRETRIECLLPGEGADTTNGLVTVREYSSSAFSYGWPQRTDHADGTLTLYRYQVPGNGKLTIISRGTPSSGGDSVVKGTEVKSRRGPNGRLLEQTTSDIASGRVTGDMEVIETDAFGRPLCTTFLDQATQAVTYACCGTETMTDREGVTTTYVRDKQGRAVETSRQGITVVREYDTLGRVTNVVRRGSDGTEQVQRKVTYDLTGETVSETDGLGQATVTSERFENGHRILTTTFPHGGTEILDYHRDGRLYERRGSAVAPVRHRYGIEQVEYDGAPRWFRFTETVAPGEDPGDTNEWTKSYVDMLGRNVLTVYPGNAREETYYNAKGQMEKVVDPDGVTMLYTYDDDGTPLHTVLDVNTNGVIDWAGEDRITSTERSVYYASRTTWTESTQRVWPTSGSSSDVEVVSTRLATADGLESIGIAHGLTNRTTRVYSPAAAASQHTVHFPDGSYQVSAHTNGLLRRTVRYDAGDHLLREERYDYDAHGRVAQVTGPAGATHYAYDVLDRVSRVTLPPAGSGVESLTVSNVYDTMGRLVRVIRSDGVTSNEYNLVGALLHTSGAGTYPVDYSYDAQGRVETMTTWSDHHAGAGPAVTAWEYGPRGRLVAKVHDDGSRQEYSYSPAGRLKTRARARPGADTSYAHDAAGSVTGITYGDGTPGVAFRYDRRGRVSEVVDALGARLFQYNARGQITNETLAGGLQVTRDYDLARPARVALGTGAGTLHDTAYAYDAASRVTHVASGPHTAAYHFAASGLLEGATFLRGGTPVLERHLDRDGLLRLTSVSNVVALTGADQHVRYQYEHLDRRSRVDFSDGSHWSYTYDDLGQLVSGTRRSEDGTPWPGQQFAYRYDDIGNRLETMEEGRTSVYASDLMNQYVQRALSGVVDLYGEAHETATVTVDDQPVERLGTYFHGTVQTDNAVHGAYVTGHVVAVVNGAGPSGEDAVMEDHRKLFLPQTPEVFTYDKDGNLVQDGQWDYTWDAENRLIRVETRDDLPPGLPRRRIGYTYDYLGRRVARQVEAWDTDHWTHLAGHRFLYDQWNLLAEIIDTPTPPYAQTNLYTWGLDLSGSIHGAAGVGGLIAVTTVDSTYYTTYYAQHDGHGNVIALIDSETGEPAAAYEYDPYGRILKAVGPLAARNPFRWSTRYTDNTTGLVLYPHRVYSPTLGRWLSRDPLGESGGLNLHAFLSNSPVNGVDPLGLALYAFDGTGTRYETWTHVSVLHRSYRGSRLYAEGVGSRWYTVPLGGAFGLGGRARLEQMYKRLVAAYKAGDEDIDIVGFSRGAALAREFANMIYERGIRESTGKTGARDYRRDTYNVIECRPEIRFVGLFDTVGSFGWPGNHLNIGIRMKLPPNVQHAAHAVANDERRREFPLTPVTQGQSGQKVSQQVFPGDHSDVGGGYKQYQNVLALSPLLYIHSQGKAAGVPFGDIRPVWDRGQLFLEVEGQRRPWHYQMHTIPHNLTHKMLYTDGGQRQNTARMN